VKTKLFCIIFFFLFINEIKSQYFIAGTHGVIYVNIIPDTLLNPPTPVSPSTSTIEDYYIDINQDGTNDIKIEAYNYQTPNASSENVSISSLDTFTSFSFGSKDSNSCYVNFNLDWNKRTVLKIYNNGDTIKNGNYVSSGYLEYNLNWTTYGCFALSNEWLNKGDVFFGVKFQTPSDTAYGWVKVNVTAYQTVLVEEFSLNKQITGVNSIDGINNSISVYPNPANGIFNLQMNTTNANSQIEIYNVYGEKVYQSHLTPAPSPSGEGWGEVIDLSSQPSGIYFLQLKTSEGIATKKIVISK
jgi:hypothetical protein